MIGLHLTSAVTALVFVATTTEAATTTHECLENDPSCLSPLPEIDEDGYLNLGYGVAQFVGADAPIMMEHLDRMHAYLHNHPKHQDNDSCQLHDDLCAYWAVRGECEENPEYMAENWAPTCFSCISTRCPSEENLPPDVWVSGSLDRMFHNLATHPYYQEQYKPQVILRPGMPSGEEEDAPWVVVVDDFLTPEETETLIKLGVERGYERSETVGDYDYLSDQRTSSTTWCLDDCFENAVTKQVLQKIENLTAIPDLHGEYLQMLKYEETQFYGRHHDYLEHHLQRAAGVRLLTVFLYLNDVEEGGGTRFSTLDVVSIYCCHCYVSMMQPVANYWPSFH